MLCLYQLEGWEGLGTETGQRLGFMCIDIYIYIFIHTYFSSKFSMSRPDFLDWSNFIKTRASRGYLRKGSTSVGLFFFCLQNMRRRVWCTAKSVGMRAQVQHT